MRPAPAQAAPRQWTGQGARDQTDMATRFWVYLPVEEVLQLLLQRQPCLPRHGGRGVRQAGVRTRRERRLLRGGAHDPGQADANHTLPVALLDDLQERLGNVLAAGLPVAVGGEDRKLLDVVDDGALGMGGYGLGRGG